MHFRKATGQDIPLILELQEKNLLKNLQPDEQQDGFLSIRYSAGQLNYLTQDLGIFVAEKHTRLAGYLIAQNLDFANQSALINSMVRRFSDIQFNGRPLTSFRIFIYGPVCINKESRGQGVLEGLYKLMLRTLHQYDIGIAFVSEKNPRSLFAHRMKLGMTVADNFEFNGQRYNTLVFAVGSSGIENH